MPWWFIDPAGRAGLAGRDIGAYTGPSTAPLRGTCTGSHPHLRHQLWGVRACNLLLFLAHVKAQQSERGVRSRFGLANDKLFRYHFVG